MMIVGALMLMVKVGLAIGIVVGCLLIFPTWYSVCETIVLILESAIWRAEGMDSLTAMFLAVFPYMSIFLIGLGVYIGFIRLMGKASSNDEVL